MNKFFQILAVAVLMVNVAVAQVKWSADHLGISFVDGEFTKVEGTVETPTGTSFNNAKVNFAIDVNSIDTRIAARDNHLKTDDFFAAEKFPKMTLKSISFKNAKVKGKYVMIADLTIRDVTKKVTFEVTQNGGIITDPWGKTRAGFTAKTKINRQDFGMKYNDKLPSGVEAVASDVDIIVNTELVLN